MSSGMVGVMLGVSVFLGLLGLLAFIWALRGGQFDDEKKMMQGLLFDGEEDLREASKLKEKRQKIKKGQKKEHSVPD